MAASSSSDCVIVCPLRFEQMSLRRTLGKQSEIQCSGPGQAAMTDWCREFSRKGHSPFWVILAGLAGGLRDDFRAGEAYLVSEVRDGESEQRWKCSEVPGAGSTCIIVSSSSIESSIESKRLLQESSGAYLVDMESAAFAASASEYGWNWAIVRGVSDGPQDTLPAGISRWVDERGGVRLGRVCIEVAKKPASIRDLLQLRGHSQQAMSAVGILIQRNFLTDMISGDNQSA